MSAEALDEGNDASREESSGVASARHLYFKGVAGLLLGFPLSLWISWLLMYTGLGPAFAPARDQVAMWLVVPLWCTVLCASFLASTRLRCVVWLLAANALAAGLWWVMR